MPWLLASPGHQQPWYWLCKIGKSWSYTKKDFNSLWHVSVEEWRCKYMFMFPLKKIARKELIFTMMSLTFQFLPLLGSGPWKSDLLLLLHASDQRVTHLKQTAHYDNISHYDTLLMLETEYSSFGGSIPCMLMPWLLKSPVHQQARYWLCRMDMYFCSSVNFIYLDQAKFKMQFKMWISFIIFKKFSILIVKVLFKGCIETDR